MAEAHPTDRAFYWLIGGLTALTFAGIFISSIFPLASKRIWLDITGTGRVVTAWMFDALPMGAIIAIGSLLIAVIVALGFILMVVDWARGVLA